jgi:hypothetical protein
MNDKDSPLMRGYRDGNKEEKQLEKERITALQAHNELRNKMSTSLDRIHAALQQFIDPKKLILHKGDTKSILESLGSGHKSINMWKNNYGIVIEHVNANFREKKSLFGLLSRQVRDECKYATIITGIFPSGLPMIELQIWTLDSMADDYGSRYFWNKASLAKTPGASVSKFSSTNEEEFLYTFGKYFREFLIGN